MCGGHLPVPPSSCPDCGSLVPPPSCDGHFLTPVWNPASAFPLWCSGSHPSEPQNQGGKPSLLDSALRTSSSCNITRSPSPTKHTLRSTYTKWVSWLKIFSEFWWYSLPLKIPKWETKYIALFKLSCLQKPFTKDFLKVFYRMEKMLGNKTLTQCLTSLLPPSVYPTSSAQTVLRHVGRHPPAQHAVGTFENKWAGDHAPCILYPWYKYKLADLLSSNHFSNSVFVQ